MQSRNRRYGSLIFALIVGWLIFVISAAKLLVFKDGRVPAGFAALTPIVIFVLWSFISPGFRQFIFSLEYAHSHLLASMESGRFRMVRGCSVPYSARRLRTARRLGRPCCWFLGSTRGDLSNQVGEPTRSSRLADPWIPRPHHGRRARRSCFPADTPDRQWIHDSSIDGTTAQHHSNVWGPSCADFSYRVHRELVQEWAAGVNIVEHPVAPHSVSITR